MHDEVTEVLEFWFADCAPEPSKASERNAFWYATNEAVDRDIETRFGATLDAAKKGACDSWLSIADAALALVIVLDQFPRNIWRGTARAFSCDAMALERSRAAIAAGYLEQLTPAQRAFLLMPFQHSESPDVQRESVELYAELIEMCSPRWQSFARTNLEFAQTHKRIIDRFGRFPHRNGMLGRRPTAEEAVWLEQGGETFGTGK